MNPAPYPDALAAALDRAIAEHFGATSRADAEQVVIATCTVAAVHIASKVDLIARGVLLAQAQWTLTRTVAELAKRDAKEGRRGTT